MTSTTRKAPPVTSARDTPEAAATTAADSHTPMPLAWHLQTEHEVAVAYELGYRQALADIAAGHVELDAAWKPIGQRRYDEQVADRLASLPPADGVEAWLNDYARRTRRHDDETIALGQRTPPRPCTRCRPQPPEVCVCPTITELRTAGPTTRRAA